MKLLHRNTKLRRPIRRRERVVAMMGVPVLVLGALCAPSPPPKHTHPGIETGYILEDEFALALDG